MPRIERPRRRTVSIITRPFPKGFTPFEARLRIRNPNKSSLYNVMQNKRKARAFHKPFIRMTDHPLDTRYGGAGRDRTDDILLAKQALSQLSYGP
jgi:hypothetical protein